MCGRYWQGRFCSGAIWPGTIYRVVTSARPCNKVGHLFWSIILVQHETDDVILYIHSVHKHRRNIFKLQNYKMRLKQIRLNWINSMQLKKILFINVFFFWSLCIPVNLWELLGGEISLLPTILRGRFCVSPLNAQNCTL